MKNLFMKFMNKIKLDDVSAIQTLHKDILSSLNCSEQVIKTIPFTEKIIQKENFLNNIRFDAF